MPEMEQPWAYPLFWLVSLVVVIGMLALFRRKEWL
jgi:Mg2+ and Co2+ transporter CorA